jgi:hypothetical protein
LLVPAFVYDQTEFGCPFAEVPIVVVTTAGLADIFLFSVEQFVQ